MYEITIAEIISIAAWAIIKVSVNQSKPSKATLHCTHTSLREQQKNVTLSIHLQNLLNVCSLKIAINLKKNPKNLSPSITRRNWTSNSRDSKRMLLPAFIYKIFWNECGLTIAINLKKKPKKFELIDYEEELDFKFFKTCVV